MQELQGSGISGFRNCRAQGCEDAGVAEFRNCRMQELQGSGVPGGGCSFPAPPGCLQALGGSRGQSFSLWAALTPRALLSRNAI